MNAGIGRDGGDHWRGLAADNDHGRHRAALQALDGGGEVETQSGNLDLQRLEQRSRRDCRRGALRSEIYLASREVRKLADIGAGEDMDFLWRKPRHEFETLVQARILGRGFR